MVTPIVTPNNFARELVICLQGREKMLCNAKLSANEYDLWIADKSLEMLEGPRLMLAIVNDLYHVGFFFRAKILDKLVQYFSNCVAICKAEQFKASMVFFGYFKSDSFFTH